jgi:amino acid transporter
MSGSGKKSLGYWEVTALGIGGMVGGGIFAVLGLSVQLTGGGAPMAFLIAGAVALVIAYSYARLSVTGISSHYVANSFRKAVLFF